VRVLIAEDDPVSRRILEHRLIRAGHEVVTAADGNEAWHALEGQPEIRLAVIDWMMPGVDGAELCRRIRRRTGGRYVYVLMLTARNQPEDVLAGFEAGADDYVTKPCDPSELQSRLRAGERIVALESALHSKVTELGDAIAQVKVLRGLLPICMFCKKIRDDANTWRRIEDYVTENSEAMFSHSMCSECAKREYPELEYSPGEGAVGPVPPEAEPGRHHPT